MNGHIKAISRPNVAAILDGSSPIDVITLKNFIVATLTAVNSLLTRKNSTTT